MYFRVLLISPCRISKIAIQPTHHLNKTTILPTASAAVTGAATSATAPSATPRGQVSERSRLRLYVSRMSSLHLKLRQMVCFAVRYEKSATLVHSRDLFDISIIS